MTRVTLLTWHVMGVSVVLLCVAGGDEAAEAGEDEEAVEAVHVSCSGGSGHSSDDVM